MENIYIVCMSQIGIRARALTVYSEMSSMEIDFHLQQIDMTIDLFIPDNPVLMIVTERFYLPMMPLYPITPPTLRM